jgi:hypothetical protein
LLGLGGITFSCRVVLNSACHLSPIVLHSPAAGAIGIALRC